MDIKIAHSTLSKYLKTNASPAQIAKALTACGPSVDRLHHLEDDYQYEIEVITNRIDTISATGLAREAAAILPRFGFTASQTNPIPQQTLKISDQKLPLTLKIVQPNLVSQVTAVIVDGVNVGPSPLWLKHELELAGERSINNLVDITNYVTRTHGHPVHFFDYDQINNHEMILRESIQGESVTTLDGKTHKLNDGDIVIEDGSGKLIDLCGIMGGESTQVTNKTTRIVIFILTYNSAKIRKSSLKYQSRTLAAQIFEKKPDPYLAPTVLNACLSHLQNLSSGHIVNKISQEYSLPKPNSIILKISNLESLLGVSVKESDVTSILSTLGFKTTPHKKGYLNVEVPTWRLHDITLPEDLIEEFARVYGYHLITPRLPMSEVASIISSNHLSWEIIVKKYLSLNGFNEIFNYSLVNRKLFELSNMPLDPSIEVTNPLSSDYTHLRRSLIPGMLQNFANNIARFNQVNIFELSNIYLSNENSPLPHEIPILCMLSTQSDYLVAKGQLEALMSYLNISDYKFTQLEDADTIFNPNLSVNLYHHEELIGVFGTIKNEVLRNHNINTSTVYIANLDFNLMSQLANNSHTYVPTASTNVLVEDITLKSHDSIGNLLEKLKTISPLIIDVNFISTYQQSHTFKVTFNDPQKDLSKEALIDLKKIILAKLSVLE